MAAAIRHIDSNSARRYADRANGTTGETHITPGPQRPTLRVIEGGRSGGESRSAHLRTARTPMRRAQPTRQLAESKARGRWSLVSKAVESFLTLELRARVAAVVGAVLLVVFMSLSLLQPTSADAAGGPSGAITDRVSLAVSTGSTYEVAAGDTFWSIASALDSDGDPRETVAELRALNGGTSLVPGQEIVLPSGLG